MSELSGRHPGTMHLVKMLEPNPNLPPDLGRVSVQCATLGEVMVALLPDGPELSAGLRHLLEAKDCFVRAALDQ